MRAAGLLAALLAALVATAGDASAERLDPKRSVERSQAALGRPVGAYKLTDSKGQQISLADYRGRPLVVSLVYSACSSVCPVTTQHLVSAVMQANRILGSDRFAVLTVGFDARNDTPARMAQFAATQGIPGDNWRVASADSGTIEALLRDLGFSYASVAGGFDHVTQTTIVDSDGRVYRHVYGDEFPVQMLMEPLKDAVWGVVRPVTLSGLLDRIKFICTAYDPGAGRYRIDYGLVFGSVIAAISLVLFGLVLLREWLRAGRPRPARRASAGERPRPHAT